MSVPTPADKVSPRVVRPAAIDWCKFDAQLARDGSVDPVDKALYAALSTFVDAEERDSGAGGEDDENVPTRHRLAACIGRSVDTVDRATKRLEARGLLHVERRTDPDSPRRNLPSVYTLLDYEIWDERAAARAEARRSARQSGQTGQAGRMDAARGGRTGAARGGRMDAARGGRTGAAVLLSSKKDLSQEGARGAREQQVPQQRTAPEDTGRAEPRERDRDVLAEGAQRVAEAWTTGTGLPRVPASEAKIAKSARELLSEGHQEAHLSRVASWMAQKGWADLGYALTAKGAPTALSGAPRATQRPARPAVVAAVRDADWDAALSTTLSGAAKVREALRAKGETV